LHTLDLTDAQVTDAGLKEIAVLKSLQTLRVGGAGMTDAGVQKLAELKQLQMLAVHHNYEANNVSELGLLQLQKAAPLLEVQIVPRAWSTNGKTLPRAAVGSP
jgi:internalin A